MSNSRQKGRTSTIPKKSYNRVFQNTPDHIIDCKTYYRCKVNEKFVKIPQNLNFTWKQDMLSRNVKDAPGSDFVCDGSLTKHHYGVVVRPHFALPPS